MKELISGSMLEIALIKIEDFEPFSFIVNNGNDWNKPLPDNLASQAQFIIDVKNDTLESATVDDNGFWIECEFGGELYSKVFYAADIQGFVDENYKPLLMKSFVESHKKPDEKKVKELLKVDLSEITDKMDQAGLAHSMKCFQENNPQLFK